MLKILRSQSTALDVCLNLLIFQGSMNALSYVCRIAALLKIPKQQRVATLQFLQGNHFPFLSTSELVKSSLFQHHHHHTSSHLQKWSDTNKKAGLWTWKWIKIALSVTHMSFQDKCREAFNRYVKFCFFFLLFKLLRDFVTGGEGLLNVLS